MKCRVKRPTQIPILEYLGFEVSYNYFDIPDEYVHTVGDYQVFDVLEYKKTYNKLFDTEYEDYRYLFFRENFLVHISKSLGLLSSAIIEDELDTVVDLLAMNFNKAVVAVRQLKSIQVLTLLLSVSEILEPKLLNKLEEALNHEN